MIFITYDNNSRSILAASDIWFDGSEEIDTGPMTVKDFDIANSIISEDMRIIPNYPVNENSEFLKKLADTDWKVVRHRDQIDLGNPTSLTQEEYVTLLKQRQAWRDIQYDKLSSDK